MSRNLSGHLDDLGLNEVVRVIALSGRSGVLTVESPEGDAELMFSRGRLVSGRLNESLDTAGKLLVAASVLENADLQTAGDATLEELLTRTATARATDVEQLHARADGALAEHLKALTIGVMLYRTGSFVFHVVENECGLATCQNFGSGWT